MLRLFVAGAALPTVAWGFLAFEFDRSHTKKKLLESAVVYIVLIISLIAFVIAGWRLPQAFITGLLISKSFRHCNRGADATLALCNNALSKGAYPRIAGT